MLKIKDNIDLKDLEKYGFRYCELETNNYCWVFYFDDEFNLTIYENNKSLEIGKDAKANYSSVDNLDILYDLIQAGLVEKVKDEKVNNN